MFDDDFPTTLPAFNERFRDEQSCRAYLKTQKWPDGFSCRRCGHDKAYELRVRKVYECARCSHQESLISGTIFEQIKKPLRLMFLAMFHVSASKRGLSASELQRLLGLGSYQTAWAWLHKLRKAMIRPDRAPLSGTVEVDESHWGAPQKGKRGRGAAGKTLIACAVEKRGQASGRVRLASIKNASGQSLEAFLAGRLKPAATAHTDGWGGYNGLERSGYRHIVSQINGSGREASGYLPRVHRVFSLLKRWLLGTHQGSASAKHLATYLEEFTFRFNRRTAASITHRFQRLAEIAMTTAPCPYWKIVGRTAPDVPLASPA